MTTEVTVPTTIETLSSPLTAEQKVKICTVLSVGCDRQTAADYTGCSLADIRNTMDRDDTFFNEVRHAEAQAQFRHMLTVQEASHANKEWRASVWWLERRYPERFGRRAGAVTVTQIRSFIVILGDLVRDGVSDDEQRERLISRLKGLSDDVDKLLRADDIELPEFTVNAEDLAEEGDI